MKESVDSRVSREGSCIGSMACSFLTKALVCPDHTLLLRLLSPYSVLSTQVLDSGAFKASKPRQDTPSHNQVGHL